MITSGIPFATSVRSPYVVPLLVLLPEHADLPDAADGEIAAGYGDLLLAQIAVQVQVDLVLIHRAVQLGIQDHRWRTDVVLSRIVVVTLIIGVVVVGSDRYRCRRAGRPGTVMVTGAARAGRATTAGEDVGFAGPGRDQGQGRGRRGAVSRVHGHAVGRVRVLLIFRGEHCKQETDLGGSQAIRFLCDSARMMIWIPLARGEERS